MDGEQQDSQEPQPECPGCRALRKEVAELRRIIEELRRAGKRQAGPFSKGPPKPKPKRPGRKPGEDYGTHFSRSEPKQIDETYQAELPAACPHCGGACVVETHTADQFQTEVVTTVVQRKFVVHVGQCGTCHERVQGRHPLQTSDALGAVRFPRAVQALLRRGLAIRDRFAAGKLSLQALPWWRTRLTNLLSDLVGPVKTHAANETFAKFLERHVDEIFTFLTPLAATTRKGTTYELLPAANYLGEQAIRPAVVNRKVWGGNRTDRGATAQSALSTIVLTTLQRAIDPLTWLQCLRQSQRPLLLPRPRR